MLESLRNSVNSWTAKVLLALLIVSFAVFGLSDVFTNRYATVIATVGEKEVTREEFATALSQDLQTLQRQAGRRISITEARQLGRDQLVLANISSRKALNAEAEALGLSADPASIRKAIEESPSFRGAGGAFDRFSYEARLNYQGLTPSEFENDVREDLARESMLQAVGVGTSAPRTLAETLHVFRNEQRILDYITLTTDDTEDPGEPTDEQLESFHKDNESAFRAPEYRKISYTWLTPETLAEEIDISDDRVAQSYESRLIEFTKSATRTLDQLLFDTEESANEAKQRIADGETFAAIAEEKDQSARDISLGTVERGDLPEDLAAQAFATTELGTVGPIKTAFGYTLLNLRAAADEEVTPLEEVSDAIRLDLALIEARNIMVEESVAMDDELAGGSSIEEVAQRTKARAGSVEAVDLFGLDRNGEPVEGLPTIPRFLASAFETETDATPVLVEADGGGYYALNVEEIIPAALRPLDTVKDEVSAAWKIDQRKQALEGIAEEIESSLGEGKTLIGIAAEREKEVSATSPLRRSDIHNTLTQDLIDAMFAAEEGAVIKGLSEGDSGYIVGTLKEIVKQDAETAQAAVDATAERYSSQLATDLVQTFQRDAMENHPLSLRPEVIEATIADLGQRY